MTLLKYEATYDEFRASWLDEMEKATNPVEKGRKFAIKLASQWLEIDPDEDDFIYADGGDGGIDIAYLQRADQDEGQEDEQEQQGDTWYLFQSKYGSSIQGSDTVLREAQKVFDTIEGRNNLSINAEGIVKRLRSFIDQESRRKQDRICLVIATTDPLNRKQFEQLNAARSEGKKRMQVNGLSFDIESVNLRTIYDDVQNAGESGSFKLQGQFLSLGDDAHVGTVGLQELYDFLVDYRARTGELDRLYEHNVRRWLGVRKAQKVNYGIKNTLEKTPQLFGFYNNGITFVADEFRERNGGGDIWTIEYPRVVNGCQTTRTLFQVLDLRLGGDDTGEDPELGEWRENLSKGRVVVKIVRVDESANGDMNQLIDITRFTNTQNAIGQRDLVALDENYNAWHDEMRKNHSRFLEIQRGGWDSRKAYEKQHPSAQPRYTDVANPQPINANDMIKIFGAGWLGYAGSAARRSADFLPSVQGDGLEGSVFRQIVRLEQFGADDLLSAHHVFVWAKERGFGKRGSQNNRNHTRYLFYYTYVQMLRAILADKIAPSDVPTDRISGATLKLVDNKDDFERLCDNACVVIDDYTKDQTDAGFSKDLKNSGRQTVENFFQSSALDAKNISQKAPEYERQLDIAISAMNISVIDGQKLVQRYRDLLTQYVC